MREKGEMLGGSGDGGGEMREKSERGVGGENAR